MMKLKNISVGLLLSLSLVLAACGNSEKSAGAEPNSNVSNNVENQVEANTSYDENDVTYPDYVQFVIDDFTEHYTKRDTITYISSDSGTEATYTFKHIVDNIYYNFPGFWLPTENTPNVISSHEMEDGSIKLYMCSLPLESDDGTKLSCSCYEISLKKNETTGEWEYTSISNYDNHPGYQKGFPKRSDYLYTPDLDNFVFLDYDREIYDYLEDYFSREDQDDSSVGGVIEKNGKRYDFAFIDPAFEIMSLSESDRDYINLEYAPDPNTVKKVRVAVFATDPETKMCRRFSVIVTALKSNGQLLIFSIKIQ